MRTCTCVSASVLVFSAAAAGQRDTIAAGACPAPGDGGSGEEGGEGAQQGSRRGLEAAAETGKPLHTHTYAHTDKIGDNHTTTGLQLPVDMSIPQMN